ncbi:unnamed protein product [Closterium sp. NIES-54]
MEICFMDVSNVFLQGDLHERIFLWRSPAFHAAFPKNTVWHLRRPIYGLKQAPKSGTRSCLPPWGPLDFLPRILTPVCSFAPHLARLCFLLAELGVPQPCPTLWCDNASTTQDPVYHARSKHIELRYFFIRELVQRGLLAVRKIAAKANLADIFTKALLRPAHSALLRLIGLARPGTFCPLLVLAC